MQLRRKLRILDKEEDEPVAEASVGGQIHDCHCQLLYRKTALVRQILLQRASAAEAVLQCRILLVSESARSAGRGSSISRSLFTAVAWNSDSVFAIECEWRSYTTLGASGNLARYGTSKQAPGPR